MLNTHIKNIKNLSACVNDKNTPDINNLVNSSTKENDPVIIDVEQADDSSISSSIFHPYYKVTTLFKLSPKL